MIPISDENRSLKFPLIRNILILLNVGIFFYVYLSGASSVENVMMRYGFLGQVFANDMPGNFYRLVTYQFLHGGFGHLIGNMWYLWIFGDNIEAHLGSIKFLIFYLFSGFISCLAQVLINHSYAIPLIGASGSIAGVLGAYSVFYPRAKIITWIPFGFFGWTTKMPAVAFLGFWFLYQFMIGSSSPSSLASAGGVAWWAHIGGFIFGLISGIFLK
ncbi:MAG: rhomboid family intramembrane serine protease [Elusimicrobia bacterium]|nr:rhomboid family intramembrane serine protease [Elusimicrobiota bacterium]